MTYVEKHEILEEILDHLDQVIIKDLKFLKLTSSFSFLPVLRIQLIYSEFVETYKAYKKRDRKGVLDGIVDMLYTIYGGFDTLKLIQDENYFKEKNPIYGDLRADKYKKVQDFHRAFRIRGCAYDTRGDWSNAAEIFFCNAHHSRDMYIFNYVAGKLFLTRSFGSELDLRLKHIISSMCLFMNSFAAYSDSIEDETEHTRSRLFTLLEAVTEFAIELGFEDVLDEAFNRVHESNMSKLDEHGQPIIDGNTGRVAKSSSYKPPVLDDLVKGINIWDC